jgi:hypothetical protein
MDDKGCSLWDVRGNDYENAEGFYSAKSLSASNHDKLQRIREILEE